jgi:hypothetical protein
MNTREGEVRLSKFQAGKVWDRAFATTWHEIGPDHPSRSALERFVRAGHGGPEVRRFLATGEIDVAAGRPGGSWKGAPRYQQVAEGTTEQAPHPDGEQSQRMHQLALTTGQPIAGSL